MSTATWEPGDPFLPDNGCGTVPDVSWGEDEKQAAIAEDSVPPPWWRPRTVSLSSGIVRACKPCGVTWRGDDPCWMCGGLESP
jgi:hypothetical protein